MTYASEVLADSPVGYWKLDEASGTKFADSSGNSRDATISGTPTFGGAAAGAGMTGTSVRSDGSVVASVPGPAGTGSLTAMSVEAWIKSEIANSSRGIMGRHRGTDDTHAELFQLRFTNGKPQAAFFQGTSAILITAPSAVSVGEWHHVVATYTPSTADGANILMYVDGTLVTSLTQSGTLGNGDLTEDTSTPLLLLNSYATEAPWVGSMDELAIYATALSATRVAAHYTAGTTASTPVDNVSPTLTATATLTTAGTPDRHIGPTIGATASLSSAPVGTSTHTASPTLAAVASLTAAITPARHASPDLAAAASLTSHALTGTVIHPTLTAQASLTTGLVQQALTAPTLTATATLDTAVTADRMLTVTLQALATLTSTAANGLRPTLQALATLASVGTDIKPTIDGSILCDWGGLDVTIDTTPGTIDGTVDCDWGGLDVHATGAAYIGTPPAIARPSFALYAADGVTWIQNLPNAIGSWQDECNAPGSITFTIPLADTTAIVAGTVVKAFWQGEARQAARITSWTTDLAVDGTRWRTYDVQPGILAMLADGVVYPEYGFSRTSGDQRTFGAMSGLDRYTGNNETNTWFQPSIWHHPAGFTMASDTGFRRGYYNSGAPAAIRDANPSWIAMTDPYALLPADSVMWVRRRLINYQADFDFQLLVAADNTCTVWLDGQEILSANPTQGAGWRETRSVTGTLTTGLHMLAAKVINKDRPSRIAFAAVIQRLDDKGNVADPAWECTRKGHSGWAVNDGTGPPLWERANVIQTLIDENTAFGVDGIARITANLPRGVDSTGVPWNHRGEYTFDVGTSVLDVVQQLCDEGMDVALDPADLTLRGYVRRGQDRSATVVLDLGSGAPDPADSENLKAYSVATTGPQWNTALMHLDDGTWVQAADADSVAAVGKRVQLLSLGSTADAQSATDAADAQFAEVAVTSRQTTAEPSALIGALAYRDYQPGDSISVPSEDGSGHMKARVMSISVDATGEVDRAWPEFVEDPT